MFFPCRKTEDVKIQRKERWILPANCFRKNSRERRFPVITRRGSMTLEAACVLPMFLFAMLSILQFAQVILTSSQLLAGMQDAAKDMAAYAYIEEMGGIGSGGHPGGAAQRRALGNLCEKPHQGKKRIYRGLRHI